MPISSGCVAKTSTTQKGRPKFFDQKKKLDQNFDQKNTRPKKNREKTKTRKATSLVKKKMMMMENRG